MTQPLTQPFSDRSILIVEDEAFIGAGLEALLRDEGARTCLVHTADDALAELSRGRFDAALLDVHLVNESTYSVADDLRRQSIPFAFLSGYLTVREGYADIPFLEKPFADETVKSTLASLLTDVAH